MTLQNNSAVPCKLVTVPKLFCYAILSKIVLLCNFIQNCFPMQFYTNIFLFSYLMCHAGLAIFLIFKKKSKKSDLFDLNQIFFI